MNNKVCKVLRGRWKAATTTYTETCRRPGRAAWQQRQSVDIGGQQRVERGQGEKTSESGGAERRKEPDGASARPIIGLRRTMANVVWERTVLHVPTGPNTEGHTLL